MAPGPFVAEHLYLQWGGTLPGNEQWSCGLRMSPINSGNVSSAASMLAAATTAVQEYHAQSSGGIQINSRALLTHVKLNAITVDGHYKEPTTNESIVANVPGGIVDASGCHPNQIALVVTLLTDVSRGPANKGRFYLPLPAYQVAADGMIAATYATNAETGTNTFITALNAINANFRVSVHSRKLGAPAQRLVTGVKVGRVLDTQRRRRRSLAENYS